MWWPCYLVRLWDKFGEKDGVWLKDAKFSMIHKSLTKLEFRRLTEEKRYKVFLSKYHKII